MKKNIVIFIAVIFLTSCHVSKKITVAEINTSKGKIQIELYDKTPKHKENFIKLANEKFYDGVLFHRVIKGFMIQGGDPDSKNATKGQMLGNGDVGYTIPAEFDTTLFHKKGALAAARTGDNVNPSKESSGCQFYIVQGKPMTDSELDAISAKYNTKLSPQKREIYKKTGGTPHLDGNYTVYGEVLMGMNVIDSIAAVKTDSNNRPLDDIKVNSVTIKTIKKKNKK
jgi:peptidyl-prolyl cis-trans isomerase B (cyclophilin B)